MKFTLNNKPITEVETDCLVIGIFEDSPLDGSAAVIDQACDGALQKLVDSGDIDSAWKHTALLHGLSGVAAKRVLVMGYGEPEKFDPVRYDRVCASAGDFLRDHAADNAHICLHETETGGRDANWRLRQAAVVLDQANYKYTTTKAPKAHDSDPLTGLSFMGGDDMQAALTEAGGMAKGYLRSRELGNLPPNICTPAYLAKTAREFEANYENVSVEILKSKAMAKLKMSALLAVGQGSANGP